MDTGNLKDEKYKHGHLQFVISVSGAAETGHCGVHALETAKQLGKEIAEHGAILMNGATSGFPLWAAMGAKEAGGRVVGLSPASGDKEHIQVYRLPIDYLDFVIYTGQGYTGRDIQLIRSSDAVIIGCGRIGTIHEFTIAFEEGKPIGVLQGEWETDAVIKEIIAKGNRPNAKIRFGSDPKKLVEDVLLMVEQDKFREEGVS